LHFAELTLNADELKKIGELSTLPKKYPGWMVERQGNDRKID